jgi:PAS domain S-box-containing protein
MLEKYGLLFGRRPCERSPEGIDLSWYSEPKGDAMRFWTRVRSAGNLATAPECAVDYRSLMDNSADVNVVAGTDGRYRYVSSACRRLFGWDPKELEGRHEDDFVHPHDLPVLHAARVELVDSDSDFTSANFRFLCRDGSTCWTETTSRPSMSTGRHWSCQSCATSQNARRIRITSSVRR